MVKIAEKIYRDPVHNMIRVDASEEVGRLLAALIDAPEFQRLRRIRQLGLAHFAYQGAEHSRFSHSLGAYHLASRILDRLSANYPISQDDRVAVLVAALVHDVGHGPFSHVLESILDFHHEDFTIAAITDRDTTIGNLLAEFSADLPARVAAIIKGEFRPSALAALVSSQLDVDRMDYLLRDSMMTGVKYGSFDLEWVIKSLEIDQDNDRLFVSSTGKYAVEDYLQARYYMYRQVYFHRTLRAAEAVLRSILRRALDLVREGEEVWHLPNSPFEKILKGKRLTLPEHLSIDDADLIFHIKRWHNSDDHILSDLSRRFLDRNLFKALDLEMDELSRADVVRDHVRSAERNGFDPKYYVVEDTAGDVPYFFYAPDDSPANDLIFVEQGSSHARIQEISTVSTAVQGLQKGYRIHRLCFPSELQCEAAAS